jgi:hypothetical protein
MPQASRSSSSPGARAPRSRRLGRMSRALGPRIWRRWDGCSTRANTTSSCSPSRGCAGVRRRSPSWRRRSSTISSRVASVMRCGCCSASPTTSGVLPVRASSHSCATSRRAPATLASTPRSAASRSCLRPRAQFPPLRGSMVPSASSSRGGSSQAGCVHARPHAGGAGSSRGVHRPRGLRSCLSATSVARRSSARSKRSVMS